MHISSIAVAASIVGSALALSIPESAVTVPHDSYQALRRSLAKYSLLSRDTTFKNSTSIAKGFDGATLYSGYVLFF